MQNERRTKEDYKVCVNHIFTNKQYFNRNVNMKQNLLTYKRFVSGHQRKHIW